MKVLFCHDGPLRKDEFNNYYGISHNDNTFRRYYALADELNVIIRVNKISSSEAERCYSKITVENFNVQEIPNISSAKGLIFNKRQAKEKIKHSVQEADYIVVRLPSIIGFYAFDYAKKFNKPCVVEVVACPWDAFWNHSLIGKGLAPIMYYATKKRVSEASHIVYVTNEFLQKRYPSNGKQVSCSNVSLNKWDDEVYKKRLRNASGLDKNDKFIIGTIGAVNVKYKGQQYIIEALGKLKSKGILNFEYQLVGGGDQSYLKSLTKKYGVEEQVVFLGALPNSDVFDWLDSIDIYAQPSKTEGLPRALIEAMSRGLPSIGAKTGGIPELLEDDYLFSISKRSIDEIISILLSFDEETLSQQCIRNFDTAKKYKKEIIEKRRQAFFYEFKN